MINRITTIVLIFFVISCSSSKKIFTIINKIDEPVFIFENEKVKFFLSKRELVSKATRKLLVTKNIEDHATEGLKHLSFLAEKNFDEYYLPLRLEDVPDLDKERLNTYLNVFSSFYEKLKKGEVLLFNKKSSRYEDSYYYKQVRDKLGTQTDVFTFENGEEFFSYVVALGE